jgi:hypothetical protein
VERYNPSRNCWVKVRPMSVGRRSPGVVAHRGKLYSVGGMGEKSDLKSTEVYDPIVNRWTKLPHNMREICGEKLIGNDVCCPGLPRSTFTLRFSTSECIASYGKPLFLKVRPEIDKH